MSSFHFHTLLLVSTFFTACFTALPTQGASVFNVSVSTSCHRTSGTNARATIQLFDRKKQSITAHLRPMPPALYQRRFQACAVDVFQVYTKYNLSVCGIVLAHDGFDILSSWEVESVEVEGITNNDQVHLPLVRFPIHQWLTPLNQRMAVVDLCSLPSKRPANETESDKMLSAVQVVPKLGGDEAEIRNRFNQGSRTNAIENAKVVTELHPPTED